MVQFETKGQTVVATSTTEAEIIAFAVAIKRGQYIKQYLKELGIESKAIIYEDNNGTISNFSSRHSQTTLRHIDTAYWYARETIEQPGWELRKVHTKHQLADLGTKLHDGNTFRRLAQAVREFDPSRDYSKLTADDQ